MHVKRFKTVCEKESLHHYIKTNCSNIPYSTFKLYLNGEGNRSSEFKKLGRPRTLSDAEEQEVLKRCLKLKEKFSHLTPAMVIREAVGFVLEGVNRITSRTSKVKIAEIVDEAKKRLLGVGGKDWYYSFIKRMKLKPHTRTRPVETIRLKKNQPEITAEYFRMLHHLLALMQIQRTIAGGMKVQGWILRSSGGVRRDGESPFGEDGWGDDLLEGRHAVVLDCWLLMVLLMLLMLLLQGFGFTFFVHSYS